jgi:hypothetical protein
MHMKGSSFLKVLASAVVVMIASVMLVTAAQADTANGAIVQRIEDGCSITLSPFGTVIADLRDTQTPSGNESFTCTGQVDPGLEPDKAVLFKDVVCGGFSGIGLGDVRYTPSGVVTATCQIRP